MISGVPVDRPDAYFAGGSVSVIALDDVYLSGNQSLVAHERFLRLSHRGILPAEPVLFCVRAL
jgi:hypothetical protein